MHVGTALVVVERATDRWVVLANDDRFLREKHFPADAELPSGMADRRDRGERRELTVRQAVFGWCAC